MTGVGVGIGVRRTIFLIDPTRCICCGLGVGVDLGRAIFTLMPVGVGAWVAVGVGPAIATRGLKTPVSGRVTVFCTELGVGPPCC